MEATYFSTSFAAFIAIVLVLSRAAANVDLGTLSAQGFTPIDASALEETAGWRDRAHHIGRSKSAPDDVKRITLTLESDACCSYRPEGEPLIVFTGKAGTHPYGL